MTNNYFCTLFNINYLVKGVAMVQSLQRHCHNSFVFILCMDDETFHVIEKFNIPNIKCLQLSEIEDDQILNAKKDRTIAEYCWTLSPCLPFFILENFPEVDFITYLDADVYFYSDLSPILDEIKKSSIAIIEHRFEPRLQDRIANGRFCVEWVSFRRDLQGMDCLRTWRDQCIEWCYYRVESGRMGDQKYLDPWPQIYNQCHVIENIGAGVAPWNYSQYKFSVAPTGVILVEFSPLIFYHFHQFQIKSINTFDRINSFYQDFCPVPEMVYLNYERSLSQVMYDGLMIYRNFPIPGNLFTKLNIFFVKIAALIRRLKAC
jgi:hypothetical protein